MRLKLGILEICVLQRKHESSKNSAYTIIFLVFDGLTKFKVKPSNQTLTSMKNEKNFLKFSRQYTTFIDLRDEFSL